VDAICLHHLVEHGAVLRLAESLLCFPKQTAAQDVFESMPLLTHLVIAPELLSGHTWAEQSYLAAIRVKSLRSLTVRVDQCHAWLLEACTHIKALTLLAYSFEGASAIAQLTGLTQLKLTWTANCEQVFPAAEQSELGRALAALSNLRSLDISHAPPGPVAQALSQLTGLTEVTLHNQGLVPDPGHLTLPGCVQLSFILRIPLQHLACINAPQLQHLDVSLKLGWKPSSEQLDTVRWLSSGILRACSSLSLDLQYNWSGSEVMSVLGQDWQPSADALPPIRPSSNGIERGSSSDVGRQWSLELCHGRCSRQCLELLPKGLTSLYLRWATRANANQSVWPHSTTSPLPLPPVTHHVPRMCTCHSFRDCSLDSDSLEPLAQLASLRVLGLYECRRDFDGLEYLFSTSVQGCLLKVRVSRHWGYERLAQECFEMRQRVLAKRGSRDTPVLA
jgi:hypothetical protein